MARGYKTGGRTNRTPNRKTQAVIDRLEALGCDPIEGMASCDGLAVLQMIEEQRNNCECLTLTSINREAQEQIIFTLFKMQEQIIFTLFKMGEPPHAVV